MPPSALPVVAAIIAAFSVFIVVVGGVSFWCALPSRRPDKPDGRYEP